VSRIVPLERYVGRPVCDADGKALGRLHEVRVRREGPELVVVEYLVGRAGLLERFSLGAFVRDIGFVIGLRPGGGYVVPWDAMEFGEDRPRCTRRAAELERFSAGSRETR
jgi:hypothetical protein